MQINITASVDVKDDKELERIHDIFFEALVNNGYQFTLTLTREEK